MVDEFAPPQVFHVAFELNSERSVVPGIRQTAIDIRAWEDEPAALAEGGNLVHGDDAGHLNGAHRFALSRPGCRTASGVMLNAHHVAFRPAGGTCRGVEVSFVLLPLTPTPPSQCYIRGSRLVDHLSMR